MKCDICENIVKEYWITSDKLTWDDVQVLSKRVADHLKNFPKHTQNLKDANNAAMIWAMKSIDRETMR